MFLSSPHIDMPKMKRLRISSSLSEYIVEGQIPYLLESLVVDETRGILGYLKLPLLYLLAKLPTGMSGVSLVIS
jgi:hypothetical protein